MTSKERHEARYQRRKAARMEKRNAQVHDAISFASVFTFARLYRSALACFRGVKWKASVQIFKSHCGINVARRLRELEGGTFRLKQSPEFRIRERGRERRINSIHIVDRIPQKCNSKYALKPVLHRSLIYDNYASQEGKGTDKARRRLKCMLERHIRRHGFTGGMIVFDFHHFFDSIQHGLVRWTLGRNFDDLRIIGMNMKIIRQNRKDVGLVLGSENSQDFAIATPNLFDHYIRDFLRVEGYGRYMDDGWIIHPDMDYLREVYDKIREYASRLGFSLNENKSRIIRFGQPFSMLKRKYSFTETGGIILRPVRESVIRERRKLKRLYRRSLEGSIGWETGLNSVNAWKSSLRGCRSWKIVTSVEALYNRLFIQNWLEGKEEGKPCTTRSYPKDRLSMPRLTIN